MKSRWGLAILLLLLGCCGTALGTNRIVIDGIHGVQDWGQWCGSTALDSLYPDIRFTMLGVEQIPLEHVLASGSFAGMAYDSVSVDLPAGVHALYAILDGPLVGHSGGYEQYPLFSIRLPDESVTSGGYGIAHVDMPASGRYTVIAQCFESARYVIGTGPALWEMCPAEDNDAVLNIHHPTRSLFTGPPARYSTVDTSYLRGFLSQGGGMGLFYDGAEPMALKPIIRLRDFGSEVTVKLDLRAFTTYAKPEPESRQPLVWHSPGADAELDYEARFQHNLNFVWRAPGSDMVENRSWATARDLKLIEFVHGKGYRINDAGTLLPGERVAVKAGRVMSFTEAVGELDRMLRQEGTTAGLTALESAEFQNRYAWAARMIARACAEPGAVVIYRLEGADYDALFPLTVEPLPAETRRVLWVDCSLPERVSRPAPVHPRLEYTERAPGEDGVFHEYGVMRETYGGDALDDLDLWGWHYYDLYGLEDSTHYIPAEHTYYYDQWGTSPIAAMLSLGVSQLNGCNTSPIRSSDPQDEILTGGEFCHAFGAPDSLYPDGSFPPVILAKTPASGGKLLATGDIAFLSDIGNNLQFGHNLFNWFHRPQTDSVPDFEISVGTIYHVLTGGGDTASTMTYVHNRGAAPLTVSATMLFNVWLSVSGPSTATIAPGDSQAYTFFWHASNLADGFFEATWDLTTNDWNESSVHWPVILRVGQWQSVPVQPTLPLAERFYLAPPYPNPFNPSTTLSFELSATGKVRLELCNVLGQRVLTLADGIYDSGRHELRVDLSAQAAGLYFVRAQCGGTVAVRKMVLIK